MALPNPEAKAEPSCMHWADDSHDLVNVDLTRLMDSNCMWCFPFSLGLAVMELNSISTAVLIPTTSLIGIGPRAGIVGVFLKMLQFRITLLVALA